jgi:hypothetical protein
MTEMPRRESVQPDRPMTPKALRELTVIARILAGAVRITLQNPASNTPTVVASLRYRRLFMEMADKLEADATELERCSLGSGSVTLSGIRLHVMMTLDRLIQIVSLSLFAVSAALVLVNG